MDEALYNYLCSFLHERKKELFDRIAANRTRHITVVLEDMYQSQNASAVMRTAEACGIQDVYVIENKNAFMVRKRISKGSSLWLTLHRFNSTEDNTVKCFEALKEKNYRIVITSSHDSDLPLEKLDVSEKTAIVFGTELLGISEKAKKLADASVTIPMHGFTESLNVSSAAAIVLHYLNSKLHNSNVNWQLSEKHQLDLKLEWAKKSVEVSDQLIELFESGTTGSNN